MKKHLISSFLAFCFLGATNLNGFSNDPDSTKYFQWIELADSSMHEENNNIAIIVLDSAIHLTSEKKWIDLEIIARTKKGVRGAIIKDLGIVEQTIKKVSNLLTHHKNELGDVFFVLQNQLDEVKFHYQMGFLKDYNKTVQIGQQLYKNSHLRIDTIQRKKLQYQTLSAMSMACAFEGRYQLAKDYLEKANLIEDHDFSFLTLGDFSLKLKEYKKAEQYFLKYIDRLKRNPKVLSDDILFKYAFHGLVEVYLSTNSLFLAETKLNEFKNLHQKGNTPSVDTYKILGKFYLAKKQPDLALQNFNQGSLKLKTTPNSTTSSVDFLDFYLGVSKAYEQQEQFIIALKECQLAFSLLLPVFQNSSYKVNPSPKNTGFPLRVLETFIQKSKLFQAKHKSSHSQEEDLSLGLQTAEAAIEWIYFILPKMDSNNDRQILIDHSYAIFESAIFFAKAMNKPKMAFEFSERSRSMVLFQALERKEDEILAATHPEIIFELKRLNAKIFEYELKQKKTQLGKDEKLSVRILDFKEKKIALEKKMEQSYSKSNIPWGAKKTRNWNQLKNQLAEGQELVEFFVGEKNIYPFLLNKKNKIQSFPPIPFDEELRNAITTIGDDIYYGKEKGRRKAYFSKAHLIFKKLFRPIFPNKLPPRLVIVPDGDLGYIPFSILLTGAVKTESGYRNLPYVFRETSISLAFSASMLFRKKAATEKHKYQKLLAYAPAFKKNQNHGKPDERKNKNLLDTLFHTIEEVSFLNDNFDVEPLLSYNATKKHFIENAYYYPFLHLATHAKVDKFETDYSFVAFTNILKNNEDRSEVDFILTLGEIYGLKLRTKMLVLSACETGIGKSLKGEGIISIARGFASTGVESIVTSLWNVPDNQTKKMVELFYKHLRGKEKKEKDIALQLAMKDYIKDKEIEDFNLHPQSWAAFTVIGDTSPVNIPSTKFNWRWLVFVVVVVSLGLFWFLFLRKRIYP